MRAAGLPDTLVVEARAKINLFLRILGRRADGYHELETLILPVSLADRLEVHASAGGEFRTLSFSLEVAGDAGIAAAVPADDSNLALRAALALAGRTGSRGFADIVLEKRVPAAAGLGGGSADAAAALRALNRLWEAGLSPDELAEVGAEVGSDVPALVHDRPVLVAGRGERVAAALVGALNWVLVPFDFDVATRDAFGWWDQDGGETGPDPERLLYAADPRVVAARDGDIESVGGLLFNDLEEPVTRRHPRIGRASTALREAGVVGAVMSGSGPTLAGLLPWGVGSLRREAEEELRAIAGRDPLYVRSAPTELE